MLFQKALRRLTPEQRRAFRAWQARARRGAGGPPEDGRKVVRNISAEEQLGRDDDPEEEVFRDFLIRLCTDNGKDDIEDHYDTACTDFVLNGPNISGEPPDIVSRFVAAIPFLDALEETGFLPPGLSSSEPEIALEALLRIWKADPDRVKRSLKEVSLAPKNRGVIFWTFNISDADRESPEILIRRIGKLPSPDEQWAILDLRAPVAEIGDKKYPTVCDAGWNAYFKPSKVGDAFGETLDLNENPPGPGVPEFVTKNREADCVTGIEPIRESHT